MKKIALVASSILILWSCGNNKSPEQIKEEARLDSLKQIRIDSLAILKSKQDNIAEIAKFEKEKEEYYENLALRKKYIGFKYEYPKSTDFISVNGSPETLSGTDNNTWVVYFPKGDVTVISNKKVNQTVSGNTGAVYISPLNSLRFVLNKLKKDKVNLNKDFYVFTGSTVGVVPILGKGLYAGKIDKLGSAKAIIH